MKVLGWYTWSIVKGVVSGSDEGEEVGFEGVDLACEPGLYSIQSSPLVYDT